MSAREAWDIAYQDALAAGLGDAEAQHYADEAERDYRAGNAIDAIDYDDWMV